MGPTRRSASIRMSQVFGRDAYSLRSWTRSRTRTPPARVSAPRARRSRRAVAHLRRRARADRARPLRAIDRADRPPRGRQDGAAQRTPQLGGACQLGHRQVRGASGPATAQTLAAAAHQAVRELGHPRGDEVDQVLGIVKSFALREAPAAAKLRDRWQPGIDVPAVTGRADSGDIEIDLVELFTDIGGLAADVGKGSRSSSTRCRTSTPRTCRRSARPATRSRSRACPSSSSARACRTCRRCCRRRSPTPRGSSATPASTGCPARPPTRRSSARRPRRSARSPRGARRDVCHHRWLPLLHPGLRQGRLGRRSVLASHGPGHPGRRSRGGVRARRGLLRLALRASDPRRARVPAGHGRRSAAESRWRRRRLVRECSRRRQQRDGIRHGG